MKKRIFLGLLALLLLAGLAGCGGKKEGASLYSQGLKLVELMDEMAQNEGYLAVMGGGAREWNDILFEASSGDRWEPKAVYAVTMSMNYDALPIQEETSDALWDRLADGIFAALPNQINAGGGVESLTATSVCAASSTFLDKNADENVMYIYVYDNAVPVAVTFLPGQDGAVSAAARYLLNEEFDVSSAKRIQAALSELMAAVVQEADMKFTVTQADPEK